MDTRKIRIVLITGDHPRHRYVAGQMLNRQQEVHWIIQSREPFMPPRKAGSSSQLTKLADLHFQGRLEAENYYFRNLGVDQDSFSSHLSVSQENLNSEMTLRYIQRVDPQIILSYGCHKLSETLTSLAQWGALNIHGGLSPKYKGAATHFWPTYFLEPHWTGVTLHTTTRQIDSGSIYLQTGVDIDSKNGIHENACQAVVNFCDVFGEVLERIDSETGLPAPVGQMGVSRLFRIADWTPHHLKLIYETFDNKVNAYCLENGLVGRAPSLINVFNNQPIH